MIFIRVVLHHVHCNYLQFRNFRIKSMQIVWASFNIYIKYRTHLRRRNNGNLDIDHIITKRLGFALSAQFSLIFGLKMDTARNIVLEVVKRYEPRKNLAEKIKNFLDTINRLCFRFKTNIVYYKS